MKNGDADRHPRHCETGIINEKNMSVADMRVSELLGSKLGG